ncbi:MAG: methylthioribulose 1-phosphate dehydratase [Gammaproteobacteria bacterium]|jgi:methylthioribulose-1-phosphate dehydratase|nr:methylthioribulose 1-phosphate dehydratase [Gammaproteobacteria bacterium]
MSAVSVDDSLWSQQVRALIDAGRELHARGWVPATSGNFSARLSDAEIALTVSGRHKGRLDETGIMRADMQGRAVGGDQRPSAETLLHTQLYRRYPEVGVVLHVHSINATLISRAVQRAGGQDLVLAGYELLKAFPGCATHATSMRVPVFDNDQDIPRLAARVDAWLDANEPIYGYLIAGHGLYAWGRDMAETLRHLEAFDFLFECELRERGMRQS